jgi:hypothetical protein
MRYQVHTVHSDVFTIQADEIFLDDRYVTFINRNENKEDEVVAAIRFDHFKSAVKIETIQ